MSIEQNYPLLYKVLRNWHNESERSPLLLNGLKEEEWELIKNEIIKVFLYCGDVAYNVSAKGIENHPDILTLERKPQKNNIEVEQTREFINQLSLSEFELPFKIGFIPAAHNLNHQSQNALLKTLEEPLKNRYLILGTRAKNKLLPTLLSRATIININQNYVEAGLKPTSTADEGLINFYQNCLKFSPVQRLKRGQEWSEGKTEKINDFFESIIPELRKKLVSSLKNGDIKNARLLTGQLKKALDYSEQLERVSGASPKLIFEAFLVRMPEE